MTSTEQTTAQASSFLVHNLMNQLNCTAAEAEKLIARSQSNPVLGRLMQEKQRSLKSKTIDDDKLVPDYYESKQQQAPPTRADLEQVTQHVSNRRDDNPHHQRHDENDDDEYDYMEVEEEIQVEYINGEMYEVVEEIEEEEEETYFEEEEVTFVDEEVTLMDEEETIVEVVEETFHEDDDQSGPHSSLWIEKDQTKKLPTTLQQSTRAMQGNGEASLNGGNNAVVVEDTVATMDDCTTVPKAAITATLGYHSPQLTSTLSLENEHKKESLPHTIMDEARVTIGDTINTTQKDNLSELNDNKSVAQVKAKSLANDKENPSLEASSTKVLSTHTDKENDTQRKIKKERQTLENVEQSDTAASSREKDFQANLPIEQIQESVFITTKANKDTQDEREGGESLVEKEPVLFDVNGDTRKVYTAASTSDHDEPMYNIQGNRNGDNIKGNLAKQKPIIGGKEVLFVQKALSTEAEQENDLTDANSSYEKDSATTSSLKKELAQPSSAQSVKTAPKTVLDEGKRQHQKQPEADSLRQKLEEEIKALEAAITNQQGTPAKTSKKCPVRRTKKILKKRVVREKQMNTKSDGAHSVASIVNVGNAGNSDKAQRSTLPIAPGKKKTGVGSNNPSSVDTVKTQARPKPVVRHESGIPYDGVVLKKSSTLRTESYNTGKEKKEPNNYNPYGCVVLKKTVPPTGVHKSTKDNTDSETTATERITGNTLVHNYSAERKPCATLPIPCTVSPDFVSSKDAQLRENTPSQQASAETTVAHADTENIDSSTAIDPAKESNIVREEPSSPTIKQTVPFEKVASIETRKMTQVTGKSVEGKRTSPVNTAATEDTTESASANIGFDGETSAENIEKKSTTSVVIPVGRTMNVRNDNPTLSPASSARAEESNVLSVDQKCTENSESTVSTTVNPSIGRPQSPVQTTVATSATRQIQTTPTLKTKDTSQSTSSSQNNQQGGTTDSIQIKGPQQVDANEKPKTMTTKAVPTSPQSTLTAESSAANGGPAVGTRGKKVTRKTSRRKRRQNATKKKRDPPAFTPSTYKANSFRQADEQGMDRIRIFGRWYQRAEPGTWFDEITSEPVYTTTTTTTVESSK